MHHCQRAQMLAVLGLSLLGLPLLQTTVQAQTKEIQDKLERQRIQIRNAEEQEKRAVQPQQDALELKLAILRKEVAKLQDEAHQRMAQIKEVEAALAGLKAAKAPEGGMQFQLHFGDGPNKQGPNEITLRRVGEEWQIVGPGGKREGPPLRIEQKEGMMRIAPADTSKVQQPPPGTAARPRVAQPPPPEARIDNLERQLQQIMRELESLRKEMKQPHPGVEGATDREIEAALRIADWQSEIDSKHAQAKSLRNTASSLPEDRPEQRLQMLRAAEALEVEVKTLQERVSRFKRVMQSQMD